MDAILSSPLEPLNSKHPALMHQVRDLVSEYEPVRIYVGQPLNLSGTPSASSAKAIAFAEQLRSTVDCDVVMIDERLTTVSASALLTQAGVNTRDQKKLIDSVAAVAILESGLAREGR
jgi:putative Holliday junction resolvase